jgi:hypothetical protein
MNISTTLQRTLNRSFLQVQKYSPQILTGVGIAGLVAAGVIAAKQTLKLESTLDDARNRIDSAKVVEVRDEDGNVTAVEPGSQTGINKAYIRNTYELGKLYWAPVTLAGASVVLILAGHQILHKRNIALVGAYKSLEQAFAEYRKRVIEEHGEEADADYRYGIREVTETGEDGKKHKVQVVNGVDSNYIYSFGPENENWDGHHEQNMFRLTRIQNYFNDMLPAKGHIFLNEVLQNLGFPHDAKGAVTGWVYKAGSGDDYIDFGLRDLQDSHGYVLLDFNVDGIILDLI